MSIALQHVTMVLKIIKFVNNQDNSLTDDLSHKQKKIASCTSLILTAT